MEVADFCFTGHAFSDGSLHGGCRKGHERAGWAGVMVDDAGLVTGGIYGTRPDLFPTSLRAELWGALMVLRHACPPITIWVDNSGVVDGYARGSSWCCSSDRPAADLWRLLWWKVDDLGGDDIEIRKVKGHATEAHIERGQSTAWHRAGIDHADHFAGRGSILAERLSPTSADSAACKQAQAWYKWLSTMVTQWPADATRRTSRQAIRHRSGRHRSRSRGDGVGDGSPAGGGDGGRVGDGSPACGGDGSCAGDASPAGGGDGSRVGDGSPAGRGGGPSRPSGSKAGTRPGHIAFGQGHEVYKSGMLYWCHICGAYAGFRFTDLKGPLLGACWQRAEGWTVGQVGQG